MILDLVGHDPAVQSALVIGGTFVLEDAATVMSAIAAHAGSIGTRLALFSLYAGIVLGDLGLYGLGALSIRVPWVRRLLPPSRWQDGEAWLHDRVFRVVFVSRFIPGARLPSYTACGALHADLRRFLAAAVVATSIWTTLLFGVSLVVGELLLQHLGAWRWVGAAGFVLTVILLGRMASQLQTARP